MVSGEGGVVGREMSGGNGVVGRRSGMGSELGMGVYVGEGVDCGIWKGSLSSGVVGSGVERGEWS